MNTHNTLNYIHCKKRLALHAQPLDKQITKVIPYSFYNSPGTIKMPTYALYHRPDIFNYIIGSDPSYPSHIYKQPKQHILIIPHEHVTYQHNSTPHIGQNQDQYLQLHHDGTEFRVPVKLDINHPYSLYIDNQDNIRALHNDILFHNGRNFGPMKDYWQDTTGHDPNEETNDDTKNLRYRFHTIMNSLITSYYNTNKKYLFKDWLRNANFKFNNDKDNQILGFIKGEYE